ncbi:MAG: acyl-CoA/acyl-ACP dehydrogenase [Pararhodobacter sp.]|nr:acyl-CoA/acyl-ACP dehydrogenase [Pararhodobacter sp.]
MHDELDPKEFEDTARAVIETCANAGDTATRGRLLAEAGLLGVMAPEAVGGMDLPIRFGVPIVSAAGAGLLAFPLIESILLARHLALVDPDLAGAIAAGQTIATIAWTGDAGAGTVGGAPMGAGAAQVLVFLADGGAGLVQPGAGVAVRPGGALDIDAPDCALDLSGANPRPVLDARAVAALRADAAILRAGFIMGSAAQCLTLAAGYAQERVQFGKPLSAYQVLRHRLSRDALAVETLRAGLTRALSEPAEGVAMAREAVWLSAARIGPEVAESAIQIFGGMGFTWEVPLHRHLRQMHTQAANGAAMAGLDALAADLFAATDNEWYGDLANAG